MEILSGKIGVNGYAIGKAYILKEKPVVEKQFSDNPEDELKRFHAAVAIVSDQLTQRKANADKETSDIVDVQIMILSDEEYAERIGRRILSEGVVAEYAVYSEGYAIANEISNIDNDYLKGRSADIRGITNSLTDALMGNVKELAFEEDTIVIADELTPEFVASIDRTKVVGLVSRKGSRTSHVSILCGNYSIPYLYGVEINDFQMQAGCEIAIDACEGKVYICPDGETSAKILNLKESAQRVSETIIGSEKITLMANIGSPKDIEDVLKAGAEGIGLFRTEFLYMGDTLPTEEEQFEAYRAVAEAMGDKETIIRTMDIGADKKSSCISLPKEENPALGKRAIRISLENTDMFRTQLRAILRAACFGNVSIMFPMITSVSEVEEIKQQIEMAVDELSKAKIDYRRPRIGVMIETPAAAVMSDALSEAVDFFSIGTNDLTQYTLALDRMAEGLDRFYDPYSEAVMRLIETVVRNAHQKGVRVGICGELGGDIKAVPRFFEMGIDELSMSPSKIAVVSNLIAKLEAASEECEFLGAPADGEVVEMSMIPDPAFSGGMLGRCIGVEPSGPDVYSPCDGLVTMVAETGHAIGIKSDLGSEILLHVGIDTVSLNGRGFSVLTKENARVKKGEKILEADIEGIRAAGLSAMVIMAVKEEV